MTDQNHELHVVFGTGALGSAVARELIQRDKPVRAVNRSGRAELPQRVEIVRGDASDPASAAAACDGATVVYHCINACPYDEWPTLLPPIMDGLIHGARSAGARIVYGDNLYMYGPVAGPLREGMPNAALGPLGKARAQVAEQLLDAHRQGVVRATIGRAADFYGPGVLASKLGEQVFDNALRGKPANLLGDADTQHSYTYIEDFARALTLLGERPEAWGEVWHVPQSETLSTRRFVELIFREAGARPRLRVAGRALVTLFGLFNPMMRGLKETLYQSEQPFVVDDGKYRNAFGATTTPPIEGIRRTLDWYRARKGSISPRAAAKSAAA